MRRLRLIVVILALLAIGLYLAARTLLGSDVVRTTLERQLAARVGQPVRIAAASAAVVPRLAVRLRDVAIGEPAAIRVAEVDVVTGWRGLLSRRIEGAEIVASRGTITLPLPFALAPAAAGGETAGAAEAAPAIVIASVRRIAFREMTLTDGRTSLRLDLDSALAGDRLDVERATLATGDTRITASGAFTSISRREGAFTAHADPLDFMDLVAATALFGGTAASAEAAAPSPMHVTVTVQAPRARYTSYTFTDLSTTVEARASRTVLAPLRLRSFGGSFDGRVDVDTARSSPVLRLKGRVSGLDVAQLLAAAGSPGGMTGRLSGDVSLAASGADAAALTASSRGTIAAAITDGAIPGLDMLRAVVLAFGKPSGAPPAGSGSAFSRLGGTLAVAGGAVSSDDLTMASRDFDMAGSGRLHLQSGAVQARASVTLSRELTAQAGTDLRRYTQEDGRIVVPATIGGTLSQPSVSPDIAAVGRRALENELRRRATSFLDGLLKKKSP